MANSPANEINAVIQQIQNIQVTMDLAVYTGNVIQDLTWIQKKAEQTKATVPVDADTSAAQKALEKIRSQIQERFGLDGLVSKVTSQLTASNGMEKILQTGAAYQQSLEKSQAAWNTLLGSQEKAADQMQYLQGMAESAPFSLEALDSGAQKLAQMGYQGRQLRQILRGAGEAAAAVGGGDASMTAIIDALAQIGREGRASQDALDAIAGQGVPVWEMLAQQMGRSVTEIRTMSQEGQLLADTVIPSLAEGMQTQFGGAMQAQSQTMQGMTTSLQNLFGQFSGIATEGAFDVLKESLGGFLEKLREGEGIRGFAQDLGGKLKWITGIVSGLITTAWELRSVILSIVTGVSIYNAFTKIGEAIKSTRETVKELGTSFLQVIATIKQIGKPTSLQTLGGLLQVLQSVAPAAAAAFGGIITLFGSIERAKGPVEELREAVKAVEKETEEQQEEIQENYAETEKRIGDAQSSYKELVRLVESGGSEGAINAVMANLLEQLPEAESLIQRLSDGTIRIDTEGIDEVLAYLRMQNEYNMHTENAEVHRSNAERWEQSANNAATLEAIHTQELQDFLYSIPEKFGGPYILPLDENGRAILNGDGSVQMPEGFDLSTNEDYNEDVYAHVQEIRVQRQAEEEARKEYEQARALEQEDRDAARAILDEFEGVPEVLQEAPLEMPEEAAAPVRQDYETEPEYSKRSTELAEELRTFLPLYAEGWEKLRLYGEGALEWISHNLGGSFSSVEEAMGEGGMTQLYYGTLRDIALELDKAFQDMELGRLLPSDVKTELLGFISLIEDAAMGEQTALDELARQVQSGRLASEVLIYIYGGNAAVVNKSEEGATTKIRQGLRPDSTYGATGYAEGTSYYPGGVTRIHERGDELIELPTGSKIYPAQRSRGYQRVENPGSPVTVNVYGMTVREEADIDRVARALYQKLRMAALNA